MPKLDDKTTDKLFQVGAGQHDFKYEPTAWKQMENLLEADDAARRRYAWLIGVGASLALILAGFGYHHWSADNKLADQAIVGQQAPIFEPANDIVAEENGTETHLSSEPGTPAATEISVSGDAINNTSKTDDALVGGKVGSSDVNTTTVQTSPVSDLPVPSGNSGEPTTGPENDQSAPQELIAVNAENGKEKSVILLLTSDQITEVSHPGSLPAVALSLAPQTEKLTSGGFRPGFAATVSAGFSSGMVEVGDFGPADSRFGLKLDYRFSNKLSIGAGVTHSNVCYRVDGTEYKAATNFFPEGPPKDVLSDCDILEVPLSLTWHPQGSDQSGLYLSGGVTSYFMLIERFDFKYENEVSDLSPKTWREDDTNRHLFGMGQFSLGYQRKAGRRSAFQVESFVQLPLTGIGQGQVNLLTVGASVNYTFDFRKKR